MYAQRLIADFRLICNNLCGAQIIIRCFKQLYETALFVNTTTSPQQTVITAVILSLALGVTKLVAGLAGNSYALVADAVESFTDIIGGAVVWGGLHISSKPATSRYPYGYGKAESLAAAIVAAIVLFVGIGIALEAILEIRTPHHAPEPFTLAVLVLVVIVKELLYRRIAKVGSEHDSTSLQADAWHHRADAVTSLCAFIGISTALFGGNGWEPADDWAALVAAGIIIFQSFRIAAVPFRELLDFTDEVFAAEIIAEATKIPGVRKVQKVHLRKSGSKHLADMHLWVSGSMNVRDAHALSHQVKDHLIEVFPSLLNVLIHLEPDKD